MANLFDYLKWRGDLDPRAVPYDEADYAILSALAYCPFEKIEGARDLARPREEDAAAKAPRQAEFTMQVK